MDTFVIIDMNNNVLCNLKYWLVFFLFFQICRSLHINNLNKMKVKQAMFHRQKYKLGKNTL